MFALMLTVFLEMKAKGIHPAYSLHCSCIPSTQHFAVTAPDLINPTTGHNLTVNYTMEKCVPTLSTTEHVQRHEPRQGKMKCLFSYPAHPALCLKCPNMTGVAMERKAVG
jgi:hypothetical protein